MVCNDSVLAGISTRDERRAVHHRGTGINRMVIAKSDSLTRKLPKRRCVLFADKIRPHPIPDDYNDVARFIR